eukprot:4109297-Amphidinium_carterae.1
MEEIMAAKGRTVVGVAEFAAVCPQWPHIHGIEALTDQTIFPAAPAQVQSARCTTLIEHRSEIFGESFGRGVLHLEDPLGQEWEYLDACRTIECREGSSPAINGRRRT